jgi:hypothetical protein
MCTTQPITWTMSPRPSTGPFETKDWNQVFQLAEMVSEWADKLWAMSVREGQIGPAPFYQEV